jgi:hypothetical protein
MESIPTAYTEKKICRFSSPQPGYHLPNSPWAGKIKLFPARESLVSDILAGDGRIANLFYSVCILAGRYDNPISTRFLAPIDRLKIPAQSSPWNRRTVGLALNVSHISSTETLVSQRSSSNSSSSSKSSSYPSR